MAPPYIDLRGKFPLKFMLTQVIVKTSKRQTLGKTKTVLPNALTGNII